jgi:cytochrome c
MKLIMVLAALLLASHALAQQADPAAGQRVFAQCRACHTIDQGGRNLVGPNLHGVWGRPAAAVAGFRYSQPMRDRAAQGLAWTEENLRAYLRDPKAVVPNGSMAFPGIRNDEQIANVLAYIRQASGAGS